ncbi:MAG: hypothetical protein HZC48_00580 [Nitrospirae bacterium]|nr:hypothetical protein [Nitrospirota bacterium]
MAKSALFSREMMVMLLSALFVRTAMCVDWLTETPEGFSPVSTSVTGFKVPAL